MIVIAVLAAIVIVSYRGANIRAMDTRIKTTVADVGEALRMAHISSGELPTQQGYFSNTNGVDSFLYDRNLLPSDYRAGITSSNAVAANPQNVVFRFYMCGNVSRFVIYASLNNPSASDIQKLQSAKTTCGHTGSAPETPPIVYNYAVIFDR